MTASFRGSLRAISVLFKSSGRVPNVPMIVDPTTGNVTRCIVTLDPVAIVVMRAGESHQFPCRHVLIAAVDRIGKKALLGILEDWVKNAAALDVLELE